MKNQATYISILIAALALATGMVLAQFCGLVIYFKGKAVLHWAIFSLLSIIVQFPAYYAAKRLLDKKPFLWTAVIAVAMVSVAFGPKFVFAVAPYTFYTGGMIALLLGVSVFGISSVVYSVFLPSSGNFLLLLAAWFFGALLFYFVPLAFDVRQYIVSFLVFLGFFYWSWHYWGSVGRRHRLGWAALVLLLLVSGEFLSFRHLRLFDDQSAYEDKIVYEANTEFHHLVITQWKDNYWFYIDRLKNLSTLDEFLFYEAMVHPAFTLADHKKDVLLLGGENGCALREILKYVSVGKVDVVSQDTVLRQIGATQPIFTTMNKDAYQNKKVNIVHDDLLHFISETHRRYDVVVIDLPDPISISTNRYYTKEFYGFCRNLLQTDGVLVTQAGSPYFATEAFHIIENTMRSAGLFTIPLHNQVVTIGEWGWLIGTKHPIANARAKMAHAQLDQIETRWLNREAIAMISSFGKDETIRDSTEVNTLAKPVVYQYYLQGNWELK